MKITAIILCLFVIAFFLPFLIDCFKKDNDEDDALDEYYEWRYGK